MARGGDFYVQQKGGLFSKIRHAFDLAHLLAWVWELITSQVSFVYVWGPLLTLWGLVSGIREGVQTPYLIASCTLIFASVTCGLAYAAEIREKYKARHKKLRVDYDRSIPSCRADVTFGDDTHSMCFRLRVENITSRRLERCEGWLESIDKFPNISPVKLFWVSSPTEAMSVDLINGVPAFCRFAEYISPIKFWLRRNPKYGR